MKNFSIIATITMLGRMCAAAFLFFQCLAPMALAGDNNQDVLNQLYREIINSSPDVKSFKMDSMHAAVKTAHPDPGAAPGADAASERLKKEIDKIVRDAQLRHSNTVKFMQDGK